MNARSRATLVEAEPHAQWQALQVFSEIVLNQYLMMNPDTLKAAPKALSTPRLRLTHPRPEHAAAVMDSVNASLAELRYIGWGQTGFDAERARRFCEHDVELVASGSCLIYFAFEASSGAFVGNLDLHSFDFEVPRCEIGYVGDARRAGAGLMFEAATALLRLGFELGVQRIEAYCDARNLRSIGFAEQLGMKREGLLRSYSRDPQGQLRDEQVLALLRDDPLPAVRPIRLFIPGHHGGFLQSSGISCHFEAPPCPSI
jgi:RimJ/RimL family protein N-acetyltransferase